MLQCQQDSLSGSFEVMRFDRPLCVEKRDPCPVPYSQGTVTSAWGCNFFLSQLAFCGKHMAGFWYLLMKNLNGKYKISGLQVDTALKCIACASSPSKHMLRVSQRLSVLCNKASETNLALLQFLWLQPWEWPYRQMWIGITCFARVWMLFPHNKLMVTNMSKESSALTAQPISSGLVCSIPVYFSGLHSCTMQLCRSHFFSLFSPQNQRKPHT